MKALNFLKIVISVMIIVITLDKLGLYVFDRYIDTRKARDSIIYPLNDIGIREDLNQSELIQLQKEKIILIGNSVVYGFGEPNKDKTIPGLLQSAIDNAKTEHPYKIVNAGLHNASFWIEFPFFKEKLLAINPKSVVWVVGTSDFKNRENALKNLEPPPNASVYKNPELTWEQITQLTFYKKLSQFLFLKLNTFISYWSLHSEFDFHSTKAMLEEPTPENFSTMISEVSEFNSFLSKRNIRLIVLFFPTREFNQKHTWAEAKPFVKLQGELEYLKIPTINFFEKFKENCLKDCYFDYSHLNERGTRFFSDNLYLELKKLGALN